MNHITKTAGELCLQMLKPPGLTGRALRLAVVASTLGAMCAYAQSVPLPPGSVDVPLPGTTSGAEPDLTGTVLADQLIEFGQRALQGGRLGIAPEPGGELGPGSLQVSIIRRSLTWRQWRVRSVGCLFSAPA